MLHHPLAHKRTNISALIDKMRLICDISLQKTKLSHVKSSLKATSYAHHDIKRPSRKLEKSSMTKETRPKTQRIGNYKLNCQNNEEENINIVLKCINKIKSLLRLLKDQKV
jgi:hypothetical protein